MIGLEANGYKIFAEAVRSQGKLDFAFLYDLKAANFFDRIGGGKQAEIALKITEKNLEGVQDFSVLMSETISNIAEIFASIEEMKQKGIVNQERLLKIEKDFKIKYENSIKN